MFESMLHQLAKELHQIKKVTMQGDNSGCYRGKQLALALPLVNSASPFKVARPVQNDAKDGKGLIDAHFSIATLNLLAYIMTTRQNVDTAHELPFALTQKGDVPNSFVQMVRADQARNDCLYLGLEDIAKAKMKGGEYSRLNDIEFEDFTAGKAVPADLVSATEAVMAFCLRVSPFSEQQSEKIDFKVKE